MPFDPHLLNPHLATLGLLTLGAGWLMAQAGLSKNALEWRRARRVCPSCGRRLDARTCSSCAG